MGPIAICKNDNIFKHSTSWKPEWVAYCEEHQISYEFFNPYHYDAVEQMGRYSAVLWAYSNYAIADLMEARNLLEVAERKGIPVFPDRHTGWHFDDKIAETYALQGVGASMPQNWVFYELDVCLQWLKDKAQYPIIGKLRCGSGASNVKKLNNFKSAKKYAKRMFAKGFDPSPSLLYKSYSKIQSTKNWKTFVSRFKRIPEFLATRRSAKKMPVEKGYCYFQEMIPNDGFDIKVVVVGDKLSFLNRSVRKGDFRASGGGSIAHDKALVTQQIIDSAFHAADKLELQCVGFDYVVDNHTGEGKIIEMCYGFDHQAIMEANGYFDRAGTWHEEALNVPVEVLCALLR